MIYLSSDWHCNHKNLLGFEAIVKRGMRKYETIEAMDEDILAVTNRYVRPDDLLIFLGDLAMVSDKSQNAYINKVKGYLDKLNCKNFMWVAGNHDRILPKRNGEYVKSIPLWQMFRWQRQCVNCDNVYKATKKACPACKIADYEHVEGIHPMGLEMRLTPKVCSQWDVPSRFENMHLICTHYSMRVWNKSHHNKENIKKTGLPKSVAVYGHSHGELPGIFCSLDVGWDVFGRPISLTELIDQVLPAHHATKEGSIYFGHHENAK